MKLPELPFSPYLYTEWKDATTPARVSKTMYIKEQMEAYGRQCALAMREACYRTCADMQQGWSSDDHLACAEAIRALEIE